MADERITIEVDIHDGVSGPARVVVKSLDDIGDKAQAAAPKVAALDHAQEEAGDSATQLAARVALAERRVKTMGNEATKSAAKITALEKRLKSLNRSGTFGFGGGKKGGMFGGAAVGGFKFLKLILIPVIFDAVGAVATLGSALGAMASVAVGGLAPLTGVLAAYPGYLAAIGQGLAATKLGFSGLGKAIQALADPETTPEELAKAMKGLSPTVKILAKDVADLNKPFKAMKKTIGEELAPGFINLTKVIRTYMPMVRQALTGTASVISNTVSRLASFLRESGTQSSVQKIMQTNTGIIRQFGDAALSVFRILLNVLVAAGPMLTKFAQNFARFMDRLASSSDDRKGLTDFFDKTYTVTKKLIRFTSDLSAAFYNVFKIGAGLGSDMGDSFLEMAANFRHFTETVTGQRSIANWFATMKPIIYEVGYLVRDISKGLASISMDKTLLGTLQMLRNDTLPALIRLLQGASGQFLPSMARIIGTIAKIMIEFKAFPAILEVIATSLEIIAATIQRLPDPIKQLLGYMVTLSSLIKFGGMVGFFKLFSTGAASSAKNVGLLSLAFGKLSTGLGNVGYVLGQSMRDITQTGTGLAVLGKSAKETGASLKNMSWLSGKVGVFAIAALGLAVLSSTQKIKQMHEEVKALNEELARTGSPEAFKASVDKRLELQNYGIGDYISSGDILGDPAKLVAHGLKEGYKTVLSGGAYQPQGLPTTLSWDERQKDIDAMRKQYDEVRLLQEKIAGTMYFNKNDQTSPWGESTANWPKEFTATTEQIEFIQKLGVEAGVDFREGFDKAYDSILRFKTINYDSVPAVRDLANSLTVLGDKFASAGDKASAYETTLASLNTIYAGGGARDSRVQAARGIDAVKQSLDGATVSVTKHNVKFKATLENNRALHDALVQQAGVISEVATSTLEQTGNTNKASAAYKNQYDQLVKQLTVLTGTEKAARQLAQKYMITPKLMNRAIKQPDFLTWISSAKRSYADIRKWLDDHPLNAKIETKVKVKKIREDAKWVKKNQKRSMQAWADRYSGNTSSTATKTTVFQTPGLNQALTGYQSIQDYTKWINENPANPKVKTDQLDAALVVAQNVRDVMQEISNLNFDDPSKKRNKEHGGLVFAGQQYIVGEGGPEAFVSSGGMFKMIGVHGQEHRTFPTDGMVIPNYALPDDTRITTALAERTASRPTSSSRREYLSTGNAAPVVNIGTINAKSDIDVIQAVKKGIAEAERNRRERG